MYFRSERKSGQDFFQNFQKKIDVRKSFVIVIALEALASPKQTTSTCESWGTQKMGKFLSESFMMEKIAAKLLFLQII